MGPAVDGAGLRRNDFNVKVVVFGDVRRLTEKRKQKAETCKPKERKNHLGPAAA